MSKWIILDRDGVINQDSDNYIKSPDEWIAIPNSLNAIAKLSQANYQIAVITNQSGIGRGYYDLNTLTQIHHKMLTQVQQAGGKISEVLYCPHTPDDNCLCRKPKAGLFQQLQQQYQMDMGQTFAIGDSLRDVQAAQVVQAQAILVKTGKGEQTLAKNQGLENIPIYDNLDQAVTWILTQS